MTRWREVTAFAPASVANVAVGFDLLGHAFAPLGDRVHARRADGAAGSVTIPDITGVATHLPTDPDRNTAGRAVQRLLASQNAAFGVELRIEKGIPLSSGLGGSAASAVAALVAANELFDSPLARGALYPFALAGEAAASGAAHGDNVGPALLGGLVLALPDRVRPLPAPSRLWAAVVHPDREVETRQARAALAEPFPLAVITAQQRALALVLTGLFESDLELIREGLRDVLVEPRRAPLVPGLADVQAAARDCSALGASISGGGPSVFAWFDGEAAARAGNTAMQAAFEGTGIACQGWCAPVAGPGAHVEDRR